MLLPVPFLSESSRSPLRDVSELNDALHNY